MGQLLCKISNLCISMHRRKLQVYWLPEQQQQQEEEEARLEQQQCRHCGCLVATTLS